MVWAKKRVSLFLLSKFPLPACFDYLLGEPTNPWCWFWVPQPSANSYRPRPCFKDSCHCPVYLEPMALGLLENVGTPPPGNESISGKSLTRKDRLGGDNLLVHVLIPRRVFLVDHFVRNPLTQRPRERLVSWSQENWRDPWWVDRRQELLIHGTYLLPTRPLRNFFFFGGGLVMIFPSLGGKQMTKKHNFHPTLASHVCFYPADWLTHNYTFEIDHWRRLTRISEVRPTKHMEEHTSNYELKCHWFL